MLLTRKSAGERNSRGLLSRTSGATPAIKALDRRTFLRNSGLGLGAGAVAPHLGFAMIGEAQAQDAKSAKKVEMKRTVCTHCSVGCAIDAVVENGVWTRHEPVFDSPINLGAHCAKGAAIREHGMTEHSHRLKQPMKLDVKTGKYRPISWETAFTEISDKLKAIKKEHTADSVFFVGSSKHNNEQAYLLRKWVSLYGTNNTDHQARICHSTTVAGVANMHSHLDCGQSRSLGTVSSSALRSPLRGAQETGMFSMAADRRMIVCQKEANECSSVDVKPRHAITARAGFSR
jgi:formate dehydrogenase major subunit